MVTWAQREQGKVYPAWWEDREKLLARRLREMNYAQLLGEKDGLPPGMTIKRNTSKFKVWLDGVEVQRQQFTSDVKAAADKLAAWIEEYRQESEDIMGLSAKAISFLKLVHQHKMTEAEASQHHAPMRASLQRKGLIGKVNGYVVITKAGLEELRGLPEFDEPTSPPTPLLEERGEEQSVDVPDMMTVTVNGDGQRVELFSASLQAARNGAMGEAGQMLADAVDTMAMKLADDVIAAMDASEEALDARLVRVVMADGIGLEAVVSHCGSEITALGGTVIKLELKEALLREVFPPLVKYLEGLDAIGAEYAVFGDLQIVVEQPIDRANELIGFELK